MKQKEGGRGLISVEDCITTERRGLYGYLKEIKEDMLSGVLKENEFTKGKGMKERRLCMKDGFKNNF